MGVAGGTFGFSSWGSAQPQPQPVVPVSELRNVHYYATIYSQDDGRLNLPRNSHSYGAFIAYDYDRRQVVERFAISWLPADDDVSLFEGVKNGRNFPLSETQNLGYQHGYVIQRWGPREVDSYLYSVARNRWLQLEEASVNNSVLYVVVDSGTRMLPFQPAMNCIHALAGVIGDFNFGMAHGPAASAEIDQLFSLHYLAWESPQEIQEAFLNFEEGK